MRPLLVWGSVFSVVDCLGLPSHRQGVQGDRRMSWLQRCMGSIADGSEFPRLRQRLVIQQFIGIH